MNTYGKGYLTIELMVALGILTTGLLGIIKVSSDAVGLSRVLGSQLVANYLAAEGIEVVKNNIDAGVLSGDIWGGFQSQTTLCYEVQYDTMNMASARSFPCGTSPSDGSGLRKLLLNERLGAYQYVSGNETPFRRVAKITRNPSGQDANEIQVDSIVFWDVRDIGFRANLEDHFFNRW